PHLLQGEVLRLRRRDLRRRAPPRHRRAQREVDGRAPRRPSGVVHDAGDPRRLSGRREIPGCRARPRRLPGGGTADHRRRRRPRALPARGGPRARVEHAAGARPALRSRDPGAARRVSEDGRGRGRGGPGGARRVGVPVAGTIVVRGAREHNLKNVDVEIPRDHLVVITGLSGSGKSSLAFDTLYAEGQRRYVESLSAYARQFLEQMAKPDCDAIEGLSPAIAIEQKGTGRSPRSTVGTVTEIADYLRLLYARVGHAFCHECGREIAAQTVQQVVDQLVRLAPDTRLFVYAPVVR